MSVTLTELECFYQRLDDKLRTSRIPFSGTWELTQACNFRCIHCYLTKTPSPGAELPLERIEGLLDEMAAAGCVGLTVTGGEPLLRPDFDAVWTAAHRRGFILSLFTNASLVSERIADVLAAHPPRQVEVSLYGATPQTYERLTGRRELLSASLDGLDRLLDRGLAVLVKAVLLSPLAEEADEMRSLAARRGVRLRFDPGLDPTLDGDPGPTSLRLDAERAVALELSDEDLRAEQSRRLGEPGGAFEDFSCGAAQRAFHLDAAGFLMPCLLVRSPRIPLAQMPFEVAWQALDATQVAFTPESPCFGCPLHPVCSFCPGLELSVVRAGQDSAYYCQVARARARVLDYGGRGSEEPRR